MVKIPTDAQITRVRQLLDQSLQNLTINDAEIFEVQPFINPHMPASEQDLNRKLHETTINHRLAYYIERNLNAAERNVYHVDIEFNRNYLQEKKLWIDSGEIVARPDIIVHSRLNEAANPQHFLVIEAKKDVLTDHDIQKIVGFITDNRYNYLFGFTVSYCAEATHVAGVLNYWDGNAIVSAPLSVNRTII